MRIKHVLQGQTELKLKQKWFNEGQMYRNVAELEFGCGDTGEDGHQFGSERVSECETVAH